MCCCHVNKTNNLEKIRLVVSVDDFPPEPAFSNSPPEVYDSESAFEKKGRICPFSFGTCMEQSHGDLSNAVANGVALLQKDTSKEGPHKRKNRLLTKLKQEKLEESLENDACKASNLAMMKKVAKVPLVIQSPHTRRTSGSSAKKLPTFPSEIDHSGKTRNAFSTKKKRDNQNIKFSGISSHEAVGETTNDVIQVAKKIYRNEKWCNSFISLVITK